MSRAQRTQTCGRDLPRSPVARWRQAHVLGLHVTTHRTEWLLRTSRMGTQETSENEPYHIQPLGWSYAGMLHSEAVMTLAPAPMVISSSYVALVGMPNACHEYLAGMASFIRQVGGVEGRRGNIVRKKVIGGQWHVAWHWSCDEPFCTSLSKG